MRPDTIRILNLLQVLSEIGIGIGYLLGLIPFVYLWSSAWVIPLVFVSLVLALLARNGTTNMTIINVVLSFLSYIPVVGYLFRAAGIVVSWINIRAITNGRSRSSY
jgi:predicted branched-subunit amino acid permease